MGNETQNAISSPELNPPVVSKVSALRRLGPGAALIFLLTFAAYWAVLKGQFIWDDPLLVEKNPLVTHSLSLRSVWFQTDFPLTVAAFWLQWLCWESWSSPMFSGRSRFPPRASAAIADCTC